LCEPLETTANGKRLVVEDSAACQKTIQSPVAQQVLKTDGAGNLTWTNGASGTVLRKDATGLLEFATLNSVLQSGPVDLGSQPLTTTGAINGTSAVFNASSSSNAVRITQTGSGNALLVEDSSNPDSTPFVITADGKVGIGTNSIYPEAIFSVRGGRTSLAADDEQYALGLRFTGTGGAVYFGASSSSVTPDAVISNAGGVALATFANSGNVGIGTIAPTDTLHVAGTAKVNGLTTLGNIAITTATTATTVGAAGGASALPATPSGYIQITINGTPYKLPYYPV